MFVTVTPEAVSEPALVSANWNKTGASTWTDFEKARAVRESSGRPDGGGAGADSRNVICLACAPDKGTGVGGSERFTGRKETVPHDQKPSTEAEYGAGDWAMTFARSVAVGSEKKASRLFTTSA